MSCCQSQAADAVFDERMAQRDLQQYRKKGPARTTRILLDALTAEGVEGATLLDIGGGIGAIPNALLEAGVTEAVAVDASSAYSEVARKEAVRRGRDELISYHHGDFVEFAQRIEPAEVVTLDRVICCYDDMEALVGAPLRGCLPARQLVEPTGRCAHQHRPAVMAGIISSFRPSARGGGAHHRQQRAREEVLSRDGGLAGNRVRAKVVIQDRLTSESAPYRCFTCFSYRAACRPNSGAVRTARGATRDVSVWVC